MMRNRHNSIRCAKRDQAGAAYVVTLLVTTVLAAVVLVFAKEMRTQTDATANQVSQT